MRRRGAACGVADGRHPRGPHGLVGQQEWRWGRGGAGRPAAGDLWRRHDMPSCVVRPDDQCERQTGRARPLHAPTGLSHGYDRAMGLHGRDVCRRPPSWRWSRLGKPCSSWMQRDTPGLTGAVARCGAGTVRGTSTVALRGCRGLRLHRCPRSAVLCSGMAQAGLQGGKGNTHAVARPPPSHDPGIHQEPRARGRPSVFPVDWRTSRIERCG